MIVTVQIEREFLYKRFCKSLDLGEVSFTSTKRIFRNQRETITAAILTVVNFQSKFSQNYRNIRRLNILELRNLLKRKTIIVIIREKMEDFW